MEVADMLAIITATPLEIPNPFHRFLVCRFSTVHVAQCREHAKEH